MRKRGYLDLTPSELHARRIAFSGLALAVLPPLLSLCHLHQLLCGATSGGSIESFVALVPLFPWVTGVALLMLGGLVVTAIGGVLLLLATRNAASRSIPATI